MSGVQQAVFQNLRSFKDPPPSGIGESYGGGYYAGSISTAGNGVADFYLVVGPVSSAQSTSKAWKTSNTSTSGTDSDIDGPSNSAAMNNASHPSAQFCEGVSAGAFTDWYMPAKNELEVCYYNLKPTTTSNVTFRGINPNSVPARASSYTTGTPAQTSSSSFKDTGAEDFDSVGQYWSSTQYSATDAWQQKFGNGGQYYASKINTYNGRVRAIRRVAV